MKSISLKLGILYIFLAILNIAFFTIAIFVNQMDLITKNTQFEIRDKVEKTYSRISLIMKDMDEVQISPGEIGELFKKRFENSAEEYLLFTSEGEVIYSSSPDLKMEEEFIAGGELAVSNYEYQGLYYTNTEKEEDYNKISEFLFYFPVQLPGEGEARYIVALFRFAGVDVNQSLAVLYRLVLILIVVITLFHVGFGFILRWIIVLPIQNLTRRSGEISNGNYAARVTITSKDELGRLGASFNQMAASIEATISELNRKNSIMEKELAMAARVQQSIYPRITEKDKRFFDIAIHHRPLIEVSGDFHNVVPIGDDHYGIIIADVSGHGVAAALITMLIREHFLSLAPKYRDTKHLLKYINESFDNLMTEYDKYFTAFYLIINKDRVVTFSNAAHPGAFVLRPGMKGIKVLDTKGLFIGLPPAVHKEYDSKRVRLKVGDKIVLYTDGITEAVNEENKFYGEERLQSVAVRMGHRKCQDMLEMILEDYNNFCDSNNRRDDETIIIIEMKNGA